MDGESEKGELALDEERSVEWDQFHENYEIIDVVDVKSATPFIIATGFAHTSWPANGLLAQAATHRGK